MYSYSGDFFKPNNIRIWSIFSNRIIFVFVFGRFFKPNNIRIHIRSFLKSQIIFVFVFGHQNTIPSPLARIMQFYSIIIVFWKFWWTQDHSCWWRSSNAPRIADNSLGDQKRSTWNSGDDDGGLPAYSHNDKIPPWWGNVSNDKGGNVLVSNFHHTW